jgi:hypothetical protein
MRRGCLPGIEHCEDTMRAATVAILVCVLPGPVALRAQVRVPIDLTAGYIYNAPGDLVPFRGAITASGSYRVAERLMVGVAAGYVRADSTEAGVLGGQVDFCLVGCFLDLEIALMGRAAGAPLGTPMVPISLGIVATLAGVRTGVLVTRDFKRDATALELLIRLDLITLGDLYELLSGGQ